MTLTALQEPPDGTTPAYSPSTRIEVMTDADLVTRIARGHNDALSELYRRHSHQLLALALRMLRNAHDAEDVLQEVYLYVWRKARQYDAVRASVFSWLVLITRSRCLDRLRKLQRIDHLREELQQEKPVPKKAAEGFGQVMNRERSVRVRQALQRLPAPQRTALELAFYHGWTQREVAECTGVPLGTVKTRTFLAMKKLRRELTGELPDLR